MENKTAIFSSFTNPACCDSLNLISSILFHVVFFITLEAIFPEVYLQGVFHLLKRRKNFHELSVYSGGWIWPFEMKNNT